MKKIELTMRVIEDRSAPLLLTEKNLPGACCCSCCCCFTIGGGTAGSVTLADHGAPSDAIQLTK